MTTDFKLLIDRLELRPHPEGGFYKEYYRSEFSKSLIPDDPESDRSFMTSIYYALHRDDFSSFHKIVSDELWFFHAGAPLTLILLTPDGTERVTIGAPETMRYEYTVPGNTWFAAKPEQDAAASYSLVSCVVSPGFSFSDFVLGTKDDLLKEFPAERDVICSFTRS